MDPGVSIALIVGAASLSGPLLLNALNGRTLARAKAQETKDRLEEKKEDYRRQDEVAARVDAAALRAEEVAAKAEEAAALLLDRDERQAEEAEAARVAAIEVARIAAERNDATDSQLRQIHTLVNSEYTAARSDLLEQTKLTLTTLKKVVALDARANRKADPEDVQAISDAEDRIANLQLLLADRLAQQRLVEAEQASTERAGS